MKRHVKEIVKLGIKYLPCKKRLFSVLRLLRPPKPVWSRLRFEGQFRVKIDGRRMFRLYSRGRGSENQLFWRGLYDGVERESIRLWIRLCEKAEVVFDVGAHLGLYSLVAAAANREARVFGFEPLGCTYEMFRRNCEMNSFKITPVRAAVGDGNETVDFFYEADNLPIASLGRGEGRQHESVPMVTIEQYVRESSIQRIDAIKIDVETFEPQVIRGMGNLLLEMMPRMIVEVLNDEVGETLEGLLGPDYLFFHIDEDSGLSRKQRIRRLSRYSRNYFFCDRGTAQSLRLI